MAVYQQINEPLRKAQRGINGQDHWCRSVMVYQLAKSQEPMDKIIGIRRLIDKATKASAPGLPHELPLAI